MSLVLVTSQSLSSTVTHERVCFVQPSFWGPGSELYGRRPVLVGTMTCYTLFHLGQALAQNIQTLMICRFFTGFFAVSPLTICGGTR